MCLYMCVFCVFVAIYLHVVPCLDCVLYGWLSAVYVVFPAWTLSSHLSSRCYTLMSFHLFSTNVSSIFTLNATKTRLFENVIKATRSVTAKIFLQTGFFYQILSINMCFSNNKSKQYQKWLRTVFTRAVFTADWQFPIYCLWRQ